MTVQERKSAYFRPDPGSPLSPREVQIIEAMVSGLKPAQIATALNLSVKTVSTYRQRIMDKTGAVTDCQLGVIAEAVLRRTREYHSEVEAARAKLVQNEIGKPQGEQKEPKQYGCPVCKQSGCECTW